MSIHTVRESASQSAGKATNRKFGQSVDAGRIVMLEPQNSPSANAYPSDSPCFASLHMAHTLRHKSATARYAALRCATPPPASLGPRPSSARPGHPRLSTPALSCRVQTFGSPTACVPTFCPGWSWLRGCQAALASGALSPFVRLSVHQGLPRVDDRPVVGLGAFETARI